MRKNLTLALLLGLLAFLVNAVFGGGSDAPADDTGARAKIGEASSPEPGPAIRSTHVEWASWRDGGPGRRSPVAEKPDPTSDDESAIDPRLEAVLRPLENVDVYVEGMNRDR